jgi:hypothetical protein
MSFKRDSLENYVLLLSAVEKMCVTSFKPKAFIKHIRPFCKTKNIKDKVLYIRVRGSNIGVCITISKDAFVVTQSYNVHEFIFYCNTSESSSKYLLSKLLKHNLLTA